MVFAVNSETSDQVSGKSNQSKSLPQNDGSDWFLWIDSLNTPFPRFWADYALVINKSLRTKYKLANAKK